MTNPTSQPLREKTRRRGEEASQWMKRQRLTRTPHSNANGTLTSKATTTSLDAMKKKTNQNTSPSSSPIPNPLREKVGGLEGEGFQMRYGQRLASVAQVRPMASELIKEELSRKKATKKSSSPSPSPMQLPLHDTRDGAA